MMFMSITFHILKGRYIADMIVFVLDMMFVLTFPSSTAISDSSVAFPLILKRSLDPSIVFPLNLETN
jgi:hypothetical protein